MHERFNLEGFRDVIVRSHIEADDLINLFAAGGQHQDACRLSAR